MKSRQNSALFSPGNITSGSRASKKPMVFEMVERLREACAIEAPPQLSGPKQELFTLIEKVCLGDLKLPHRLPCRAVCQVLFFSCELAHSTNNRYNK